MRESRVMAQCPSCEETTDRLVVEARWVELLSTGKRSMYMTLPQPNPIFPTLRTAESPWEFAPR